MSSQHLSQNAESSHEKMHPTFSDKVTRAIRKAFRPLGVTKLAIIVGIMALAAYAIQRLPDLRSRPEYRILSSKIQIIPEPTSPIPMDLLSQVCKSGRIPRELSLLDDSLSASIAKAFERHPWIEQVLEVRKTSSSGIRVELKYRHPVAMVKIDGGHIPIDAQGYVLPSSDFSPSDIKRFPSILGVTKTKATSVGTMWRDPVLLGATRIARELEPQWKELKLDSILMPQSPQLDKKLEDTSYSLKTSDGSIVLWGRAPGTDHPGELTVSQKIQRLQKYLHEFGGYSSPNGPYEIDIRHWQEISRKSTKPGTTVISKGKERTKR